MNEHLPPPSIVEIADWLRVFHAPGSVVEFRALGVIDNPKYPPFTVAGYFDYDHLDGMAGACLVWTPKAEGVYQTINPVDPGLLALVNNRVVRKPKSTANDGRILRRRWLVLDADPARISPETGKPLPPGIPSTDPEKALARERLDKVVHDLTARGWPEPIRGDSGNGYHAWYRIDLPADDRGLVERVLKAINARYGDEKVKIDTSLFNPSRLIKLYGSLARKGDGTPERPHRWARVLSVPPVIRLVSRDLLDDLAGEAPAPEPQPERSGAPGQSSTWTMTVGGASPAERARAYVFAPKFPDSIEGQNGHGRLYHVACVLVDGFGLDYGEAMPIFRDWNAAKAKPPESEDQLEHKLADAIKNHPAPSLKLLNARRDGDDAGRAAEAKAPKPDGPAAGGPWVRVEPDTVLCHDRDPANYGFVVEDLGDRCKMVFRPGEPGEAYATIPKSLLTWPDGRPLTEPAAPAGSGSAPPPIDWPAEPRPVRCELRPVPPLEPAMIPAPLRPWLGDIAERVSCPPDFPAVGALVALAIAVGRKVAIRPKRHDDWTVVPNLWGSIVGRPGVMKTPALTEASKPLRRLEADARQRHEEAVREHNAMLMAAEVRADVAKGNFKKAVKDGKPQAVLEELARDMAQAAPPSAPVLCRYTTNDPTVESLGELLRDNPNGIGLVRDELSGWLRSFDKDGRECDRAFYLEAWNGHGGTFTYDRIGRGTVLIPSPCVSVLGGIQPGPLRALLRRVVQGGEADDGLISRFQLFVWPDAADWRNVDRWPDTAAKNRAYAIFKALDSLEPSTIGATADEDDSPPYLRFDSEAQDLFDSWRADLETRLRAPEESPMVENHLAKYRSLMPSLALLFHLIEVADGAGVAPVTPRAAELAIRWCEYLEAHARRIYASVGDTDLEPARALAEKIKAGVLPSPFTHRDIYIRGWSSLDTEGTRRAVTALQEYGWLQVTAVTGTGGRDREDIYIHPSLPRRGGDKTEKCPPEGTDKTDKSPSDPPFDGFVGAPEGTNPENSPSAGEESGGDPHWSTGVGFDFTGMFEEFAPTGPDEREAPPTPEGDPVVELIL